MGSHTHLNRGRKANETNCSALIIPYARRRALELVLSLSGYEADKDAYLEAKGILERAIAALDDGRDPADSIERIDGQLVEL